MTCDVSSCDNEAVTNIRFSTETDWGYCAKHGKLVGLTLVKPQGKKPYWKRLDDRLDYKIIKRKISEEG
jgi:hypothetical protein